MSEILLEVVGLKTYFRSEQGLIKAVDDVSFDLRKGETLGIVGESGCGKSVMSLSIMQLVPRPGGKIVSGRITYYKDDTPIDITSLDPRGPKMRSIRGNDMSMIFQDPMTSLNPVYSIGNQIMEAIRLHQGVGRSEARERAIDMLRSVGIAAPERRIDEYPHQLSGGMRQRAMIAMALSCNPSLLIADEPTTALDVTIQSQILELLMQLQEQSTMSTIVITHDLGVIAEMARRVIVMYAGKFVEQADTDSIFYNPCHPYTRGLLSSIPRIGNKERLVPIAGSIPDLADLPPGCYFAPRCPHAENRCRQEEPPMYRVGDDHYAKCWLCEERGVPVS